MHFTNHERQEGYWDLFIFIIFPKYNNFIFMYAAITNNQTGETSFIY